jgi:hypothetical protein
MCAAARCTAATAAGGVDGVGCAERVVSDHRKRDELYLGEDLPTISGPYTVIAHACGARLCIAAVWVTDLHIAGCARWHAARDM